MNHPLLINNSASQIRLANFVEVMALCLSTACLQRVLPTFSGTQSGWGIGWLWPRLVESPQTGIAVVDDIVIRHTRPLGGPDYGAMRAKGQSPLDQLLRFQKAEGIEKARTEFHHVLRRSKRASNDRPESLMFRPRLMSGHWRAFIEAPLRRALLAQALGRFKRPHRHLDQLPT